MLKFGEFSTQQEERTCSEVVNSVARLIGARGGLYDYDFEAANYYLSHDLPGRHDK